MNSLRNKVGIRGRAPILDINVLWEEPCQSHEKSSTVEDIVGSSNLEAKGSPRPQNGMYIQEVTEIDQRNGVYE